MYDQWTEAMVAYAASKIGCGYIYGATGWVCSEARRKQQAELYPQYYNNIMVVGKKWDGKQCFDCAQLTKWTTIIKCNTLPRESGDILITN